MSGLAIDASYLLAKFDTMDATDEVDRQLQNSYQTATVLLLVLNAIARGSDPDPSLVGPQAGNYLMPSHVAADDRVTYESTIDNALSAMVDLHAACDLVVNLS